MTIQDLQPRGLGSSRALATALLASGLLITTAESARGAPGGSEPATRPGPMARLAPLDDAATARRRPPARPGMAPTRKPPQNTARPAPTPARLVPTVPPRRKATPPPARPSASADPYAGLDRTGTPALPPRDARLPAKSAKDGTKRPLPNYDGRRAPRLTAGQVLVWVPRVLFFPVYATLEWVVRWPLVQLITVLEKYHVIDRLKSVFTFGDSDAVLLPTLYVDFSRFASAGFYFGYKDLGAKGNNLMVQAGFWSGDWYHAVVRDSFKIFAKDEGTVTLRTEFFYRPDHVFHGLGPNTMQSAESFFRLRQTEVELSLRAVLSDLNRVFFGFFYRNVKIESGQGTAIDDPSRAGYWDVNDPAQVPGYGTTFNLLSTRVKLDLDTRNPERLTTPGTGIRAELFGSFQVDPGNTRLNFFQWGGELAGFWDVSGNNHVFALRVRVEAQEQTGPDAVPISERLFLGGGTERLPGFLEGRFRGDSAFLMSLQYRYPIWSMLDAALFVSAGNVFTGRFDDFAFRRMVMTWGLALRTNNSRDVSFDLMVAFGTNQFEHWDSNFRVDNIRVTAGVNQGF